MLDTSKVKCLKEIKAPDGALFALAIVTSQSTRARERANHFVKLAHEAEADKVPQQVTGGSSSNRFGEEPLERIPLLRAYLAGLK
jgi:hypothetical protein